MDNYNEGAAAFEQRLKELQELARPSHLGANLKEVVLYEKLMQLQKQLNNIELILSGGSRS